MIAPEPAFEGLEGVAFELPQDECSGPVGWDRLELRDSHREKDGLQFVPIEEAVVRRLRRTNVGWLVGFTLAQLGVPPGRPAVGVDGRPLAVGRVNRLLVGEG